MYDLKKIKARLEDLGASPKKSLGQNFLVNPEAIKKILALVVNLRPESLIEVGPGLGALTEGLILYGKPLLLIELDRAFAQYWRNLGVRVWEEDALRSNWNQTELQAPIALVSNLPYQISASLVIDRSIEPAGVEWMILMFQKEVAQRITAGPRTKDYGLLSVMAQSFWKLEKLLEVSSKDFYPPPQVASRVLVFRRQKHTPNARFLPFMKAAFAQRRKLLLKNLTSRYDIGSLEESFQRLELEPRARAEEISVEKYRQLFESLEGP